MAVTILASWPPGRTGSWSLCADDAQQSFGSSFGASSGWPNIELRESDKEIRAVAELPGLEQKDVDVSLDNDVLTIHGEKKGSSTARSIASGYKVPSSVRCSWGPDADPEKITADLAMAC